MVTPSTLLPIPIPGGNGPDQTDSLSVSSSRDSESQNAQNSPRFAAVLGKAQAQRDTGPTGKPNVSGKPKPPITDKSVKDAPAEKDSATDTPNAKESASEPTAETQTATNGQTATGSNEPEKQTPATPATSVTPSASVTATPVVAPGTTPVVASALPNVLPAVPVANPAPVLPQAVPVSGVTAPTQAAQPLPGMQLATVAQLASATQLVPGTQTTPATQAISAVQPASTAIPQTPVDNGPTNAPSAVNLLAALPTSPATNAPARNPLTLFNPPMDSHAVVNSPASGVGVAPPVPASPAETGVPAQAVTLTPAPAPTLVPTPALGLQAIAPETPGTTVNAVPTVAVTTANLTATPHPVIPVAETPQTHTTPATPVPVVALPEGKPQGEPTITDGKVSEPAQPVSGEETPVVTRQIVTQRLDTIERLRVTGEIPTARAATGATPLDESKPASATPQTALIVPQAPAPVALKAEIPQAAVQTPTAPAPLPTETTPLEMTQTTALPSITVAATAANTPAVQNSANPAQRSEQPSLPTTTSLASTAANIAVGQAESAGAETHQDTGNRQEQPATPTPRSAPSTPEGVVTGAARSASGDNVVPTPAPAARAGPTVERQHIVDQVTRHLEVMRLTNGRGELSLRLEPEHLGALKLTISSHANGVVAHIFTETKQAQQAMESAKDQLRAALESKGLRLSSLDVSVGQGAVSDGREAFSTPQERAALRQTGRTATAVQDREIVAPEATIGVAVVRDRVSRLDYRA